MFAIQQLGPSPGTVIIETDLTLQQGILGERLHRGLRTGRSRPQGRSLLSEATAPAPVFSEASQRFEVMGELTGIKHAQVCSFLNLSPSPFHPLLSDDIKWKWYAFGRQEADKQEAQLSLSFVQPAVKYMQ